MMKTKTIEFTMGYLIRGNDLLMTHRNRTSDDFHYGMWIVPGGKLESGEMAIEGIEREFREETKLQLLNTNYRGMVRIDNEERTRPDGSPFDFNATIFIFSAKRFSGTRSNTDEEGNPHYWVPVENIASKPMHEGDHLIWKLIRSGDLFEARLKYKNEKLIESKVHIDEYCA